MDRPGRTSPTVSVVVPCHNAAGVLPASLSALMEQTAKPSEIIVVDDASTDDSARVAGEYDGVKVVRMPFNSGAAAARNAGAGRAAGEILLFVDADVALRPEALERLIERFSAPDKPDAVVGAYTPRPPGGNFYTRAHNHFTRYNHARQQGEIQWFWGAVGAVKKDAFLAVGGFDQRRYRGASAEDIELGFRLARAGYRIVIDHSIAGDHLARFDLRRVLHNDFRKSALGVVLFLQENPRMNLKHGFADPANGAAVILAGSASAAAVATGRLGLKRAMPALMVNPSLANSRWKSWRACAAKSRATFQGATIRRSSPPEKIV